MEYPLYIEGERRGTLKVERQGLFTLFEAVCPEGGGLVRLSVYGGGREGYLGLMEPCGEGARLRRSLSREAMKGFPERIERAAEAGLSQEEAKPPREASPSPAPAAEEGLIWYSRPDGTLTAFDGQGSLVAIPADLRHSAPGIVLKRIGSRNYLVFRY